MRCQICLGETDNTDIYHAKCVKAFFKTNTAPLLDYGLADLNTLAKTIVQSRITIPGVQAKLSLDIQTLSNIKKLTIVGLWGAYILKPPVKDYPHLPENEHLSMRLAELFEIETVPYGLIQLGSGELAYISRRQDRQSGNRLHQEDMCQLSDKLTEQKYLGSIEQIGKLIYRYATDPQFDCIRLFDLVLYCFLIGNGDMHLKNFSLFYDPSKGLRLSPAYDLVSTRLVIPQSKDPEESALTINGKKKNLTRNDFIALARQFSLTDRQIENRFVYFRRRIDAVGRWIARSFLPEDLKENYRAIFEERCARLLI